MLKLVKPSRQYLPAFLSVLDDYRADKNHFGRGGIDPLIRAIEEDTVDEYLKKLDDYEHEETIKPGLVPETRLWLIDGDDFIGSFSVRHRLTPELELRGGHIAANIAPKHRGKYSSFIGVKMCIDYAAKLGLERVLMTCSAHNNASYRAIMGLMGLYGGTVLPDVTVGEHNEHRVWINTKKQKNT